MVIDSSAIGAMLFDEPEAPLFERMIADDPFRVLSAVTLVEAGIIVEARLGDAGARELDLWLQRVGIEIVPADSEQADIARRAWRRFGKGRHPAGLNFGDCFSYALAIARDQPLLFKGNDFAQTDVRPCAPRASS
jgi:ribonuclease VapC